MTGGRLNLVLLAGAAVLLVAIAGVRLSTRLGVPSLLLYLAAPNPWQPLQAFISRPDGTARKQLTNAPGGITEAVLSGLGNLAYAVTGGGRLLSVDVATGELERRLLLTLGVEGLGVGGGRGVVDDDRHRPVG